jgi:hypothetical protein
LFSYLLKGEPDHICTRGILLAFYWLFEKCWQSQRPLLISNQHNPLGAKICISFFVHCIGNPASAAGVIFKHRPIAHHPNILARLPPANDHRPKAG